MKRDHGAIKEELAALKSAGVIRPVDVVEYARDESTALHACFTWSDHFAAHQYRLLEARNLLRVYVLVEDGKATDIRAFVSLTTDRTQDGGGYRAMADVMSDSTMRDQMLRDALVQLRNVQKKYKGLQKLNKVWDAVDEVESEGVNIAA